MSFCLLFPCMYHKFADKYLLSISQIGSITVEFLLTVFKKLTRDSFVSNNESNQPEKFQTKMLKMWSWFEKSLLKISFWSLEKNKKLRTSMNIQNMLVWSTSIWILYSQPNFYLQWPSSVRISRWWCYSEKNIFWKEVTDITVIINM